MKIKETIRCVTIPCMFALLASCQAAMTPQQVSKHFWSAIAEHDLIKIKKYSFNNEEINNADSVELPAVESYVFGKIIIDGNQAEVETELNIATEQKKNEFDLITSLELVNKKWQVNYEATMLPFKFEQEMADLKEDMAELTQEFAEEIESVVEDIKQRALPKIQERIEQAQEEIKNNLPELKTMIDDFMKELQKSLEESLPPPTPEPSEPDKSTET